jgi:hypothetical protein
MYLFVLTNGRFFHQKYFSIGEIDRNYKGISSTIFSTIRPKNG